MSANALEVIDLGKRYQLGEREQYRALRDVVARAPRAIVGSVRRRPDAAAPQHTWALRHVGFEVASGEAVGIIGRNGAGKSTLLKLLSRITKPTEGRAVMRGRVGSLLEVGSGFHPELTGAENIVLNGAILGMPKGEIDARFDEIAQFSGVERFLHTPVKRYSTGMYMRLAFAVAAHLEPDILVIDEVLAVGDAEFQRRCLGRMSELAGGGGRTVLFVSHDLDAVRQLCGRSIWLDDGTVRADGPTDEVIAKYLGSQAAPSGSGEWIDVSELRRRGTGEVRIDRVRFAGSGAASGLPYSEADAVVELEITVHRAVNVGSVAATLSTPSGTLLLAVDPLASDDLGLQLEAGSHRLIVHIERLPLLPGNYSLGVWVARGRGDRAWSVFDLIEDCAQIELLPDPSRPATRAVGLVRCASRLDHVAR